MDVARAASSSLEYKGLERPKGRTLPPPSSRTPSSAFLVRPISLFVSEVLYSTSFTMKLLPIAAAFVALSARIAAADIVIDKMWSSTYDGSKVQELSNPAIKFVPGTPLTASVNVTDSQKAASKDAHDQVGINIVDNEVHQMVDALVEVSPIVSQSLCKTSS